MVRTGPPEYFDPTAEDGQTSDPSENACEGERLQALSDNARQIAVEAQIAADHATALETALVETQIQASQRSWIPRRWCPGRWATDTALPDGSRGARGGRGGHRGSRRGIESESSASGYSSSARDDAVPVPTPQVGTRRPPGDLYVICNPEVAPRGVYLSKSRLESAFCTGVSWVRLPGPPEDIWVFAHAELYEAVQTYFRRFPRSGQLKIFK